MKDVNDHDYIKKKGLPIVNSRNRENVSVRISARAIVIVNVTDCVIEVGFDLEEGITLEARRTS